MCSDEARWERISSSANDWHQTTSNETEYKRTQVYTSDVKISQMISCAIQVAETTKWCGLLPESHNDWQRVHIISNEIGWGHEICLSVYVCEYSQIYQSTVKRTSPEAADCKHVWFTWLQRKSYNLKRITWPHMIFKCVERRQLSKCEHSILIILSSFGTLYWIGNCMASNELVQCITTNAWRSLWDTTMTLSDLMQKTWAYLFAKLVYIWPHMCSCSTTR